MDEAKTNMDENILKFNSR